MSRKRSRPDSGRQSTTNTRRAGERGAVEDTQSKQFRPRAVAGSRRLQLVDDVQVSGQPRVRAARAVVMESSGTHAGCHDATPRLRSQTKGSLHTSAIHLRGDAQATKVPQANLARRIRRDESGPILASPHPASPAMSSDTTGAAPPSTHTNPGTTGSDQPFIVYISHICEIRQDVPLRVELDFEAPLATSLRGALTRLGFPTANPSKLSLWTDRARLRGTETLKDVVESHRLASGAYVKVLVRDHVLTDEQRRSRLAEVVARDMHELSILDPIGRAISMLRHAEVSRKVIEEPGFPQSEVLSLNAPWPDSHTSELFVRPCYPVIFEQLLEQLSSPKPYFVGLTGQPGIGKTMFGWYCIFRVLMEQPHRSIVYVVGDKRRMYFVPAFDGTMYTGSISDETMTLISALCDAVFISDSVVIPQQLASFGVVLGSPRVFNQEIARRLMKQFLLYSPLYLPIPNEAEMRCMHKSSYSYLPQAGVDRRRAFWGNIPRFVFANVSRLAQKANAKGMIAIRSTHLAALLRREYLSSSITLDDDSPHRLLLEYAAGQHASLPESSFDYYERGVVLPASEPLAKFAQSLVRDTQIESMIRVTSTARGHGQFSALRGFLFEYQVLAVLELGGTFRFETLLRSGSSKTREIRFNPQQRVEFTRGQLKSLHPRGRLLVPDHQNHPVFDAYVWDDLHARHCPVNATVAPRHHINAVHLKNNLAALGWLKQTKKGVALALAAVRRTPSPAAVRRVPIYWIVPEDVASEWRACMPIGSPEQRETMGSMCKDLEDIIEQRLIVVRRSDALKAFQSLLGDPQKELLELAASLGEEDD